MELIKTPLNDCFILKPKVYGDNRGFFFESFNQQTFLNLTGVSSQFVQDNHSRSRQGVLRGLHYQMEKPQGKLVRVLTGKIFDVAVDLRKSSSTFGKYFGICISAEGKEQVWIPPGFAHGFVVLEGEAEIAYKTTEYYAPEFEKCIIWNDSTLKIDWKMDSEPILSAKDKLGIPFKEAPYYE